MVIHIFKIYEKKFTKFEKIPQNFRKKYQKKSKKNLEEFRKIPEKGTPVVCKKGGNIISKNHANKGRNKKNLSISKKHEK